MLKLLLTLLLFNISYMLADDATESPDTVATASANEPTQIADIEVTAQMEIENETTDIASAEADDEDDEDDEDMDATSGPDSNEMDNTDIDDADDSSYTDIGDENESDTDEGTSNDNNTSGDEDENSNNSNENDTSNDEHNNESDTSGDNDKNSGDDENDISGENNNNSEEDDNNSEEDTADSVEDECKGKRPSDCEGEIGDDGDKECAYNTITRRCYGITRREGQFGSGNFDDGFVAAQANAGDTTTQLEAVIGIMGGIIAALLLAICGGIYYLYKQTQKGNVHTMIEMDQMNAPVNGQTLNVNDDGMQLIDNQVRN